MGVLSLIAGVICIVISLFMFIPSIKKADSTKEKWSDVFCKKKVQDIAIFYTECCHQRFCFS